jgi:Mlc titration factor MtfA (ptsG expression regulator)
MFKLIRSWHRRRLSRRPFPAAWMPVVERRLTFAARYDAAAHERFLLHLKVFAWDKSWEGAHGLEVTDEMKVVISGAAARLARNLTLDVYDGLHSLVVYPSHFHLPEDDAVIFGEARGWGSVMLSWDAVLAGLKTPNDGHDTAVHELAHVLDSGGGIFDGTPELHELRDYQAWAAVLSRHYFALRRRPNRGLLRAYGATNEAEFFAVATEAFFEKPLVLERRAPDLYLELKKYYRVDPAKLAREVRPVAP